MTFFYHNGFLTESLPEVDMNIVKIVIEFLVEISIFCYTLK